MLLHVALRSPLAFKAAAPPTADWMRTPPEAVGITFEQSLFVWHPPMTDEDDLVHTEYGPMVAVVYESDDTRHTVAGSLQRFLSAISFAYEQPVEDESYGGTGGRGGGDPFSPYGARTPKAYAGTYVAEAPTALVISASDEDTETLRLALAAFREGMNAGSPFYKCLAFKNVLDAVYDVRRETQRGAVTPEAAARDAFIDEAAQGGRFFSRTTPDQGWATHLRDNVRNAVAHIIRDEGRRQVNPDDPEDRQSLSADAPLLQDLAHHAISTRWPNAVTATRRDT